ncbi:MAG TPA: Zn-dependent alcohol dehydrogenase [Myxococcota bacterium]|nr:Zn-dependent alcohol dehydrogenase [Myxococcota bacterium]
MKAAVCRKFGAPLEIEDVELAPPSRAEVKVRIHACAICHSDIHCVEGAWGGELPAIYGHEAAGIVEQVGEGVGAVKAGDPVVVTLVRSCYRCALCAQGLHACCEAEFPLDAASPLRSARDGAAIDHGLRTAAFAEHALVHESQLVAIPRDVPLDRAALLACGVITGYGAVVNTAKVPAGASVAVIGTGGVGLNSVQAAAISGAHPIIAIDPSEPKRAAALRFGATHALDPTNAKLRREVKALTSGRGVDFAFVAVGAKQAADASYKLIARGGTVVLVGMPPLGVKSEFDVTLFASAAQRIVGSTMGGADIQTAIPTLVDLYRERRLKLDELISARYPLESINEAIASVQHGSALRNVIVFD